jgi:hypothetical protein
MKDRDTSKPSKGPGHDEVHHGGKPAPGAGLTAEQAREAQEAEVARDAEANIRGRMVDIGRGNQQAGRQKP